MKAKNSLCDQVCSSCNRSPLKLISDGKKVHGAMKVDLGCRVLKCPGCGNCKVNGRIHDELHEQYHMPGQDPSGGFQSHFQGKA